ncbi:FKBP-type peptidyl-prolyl cis-trans isomerase [uncultured archaeon]|nr:FKBP-type peptidyl-prolyl cis-trans isomerase [uncultured archaeon]
MFRHGQSMPTPTFLFPPQGKCVMQKSKLVFAGIAIAMLLAGCSQQPGQGNTQAPAGASDANGAGSMSTLSVSNGDSVKVEYTGKFTDGNIFDQSEAGSPLEFTVGAGQMIKGFDKAVLGMKLNEEKTITLQPEDAYGPVTDEALIWVPKEKMPSDTNVTIGTKLMTSSGIPVTVIDMNADSVKVDFNHPLAGKTLVFRLKVVDIQKATS